MKPLTPASPHAIIMIGIPGSGKSMFAERFADTFQAPIISQTKLQQEYGLPLEAVEKLRGFILGEYMKTHRTVLIDGGVNSRPKRDELVRMLVKAGYRPLIVWVQTDTTEAHRRATRPYPRGSGLNTEDFDALVAQFDAPTEKDKTIVISGKHTYTSQLKIILKQLATPDTTQPKVPVDEKQKPAATSKTPPRNRPNQRRIFLS